MGRHDFEIGAVAAAVTDGNLDWVALGDRLERRERGEFGFDRALERGHIGLQRIVMNAQR